MFALLGGGWSGCVKGWFVDGCYVALNWSVGGRAMCGSLGLGMVECVKGVLDILGHGNVNVAVLVVPFQGHATVQGAIPIKGNGVALLEGVHKMLSILLVGVLHTKIINTEAEPDGSCVVFPKSRCVFGGSVAMCG